MLAPNTTLRNRYQIVRQLGQGGMGAVYLATDQTFGSTVALKETLISDEHLRKAFEREARLLNSLRHAGLPHVFDYFFEGDGQFLVMQFIPGEDLGQQLKRYQRAFAPDDVLKWADELLDLLDYLHTHEPPIIHRDIKPENLKLTQRGDIILLDFGLAKGSTDQMTQVSSKSLFGYTPHYAPFEQIRGTGTDPRSDLYSLAATIFHLLSGKLPPDALTRAECVLNGEPDPLGNLPGLLPMITPQVAGVFQRALAQKRDHRHPTAAVMRAELKEAVKTIPATVKVAQPPNYLQTMVESSTPPPFPQPYPVTPSNPPISPVVPSNPPQQPFQHVQAPPPVQPSYPHTPQPAYPISQPGTPSYTPAPPTAHVPAPKSGGNAKLLIAFAVAAVLILAVAAVLVIFVVPKLLNPANSNTANTNASSNTSQSNVNSGTPPSGTIRTLDAATSINAPTAVAKVSLSGDGKYVASVGEESSIRVWEAGSASLARELSAGGGEISAVSFSPDGAYVTAGNVDGQVHTWKASDGSEVRGYDGHSDKVFLIEYAADGSRFATAGFDKVVKVWKSSDGSEVASIDAPAQDDTIVHVTKDLGTVAYYDAQKGVTIWSIAQNRQSASLSGHNYDLSSGSFSPDGSMLALGSPDGTVRIWKTADGSMARELKSNGGAVTNLRWSPDGALLASGSNDGSVRLWGKDGTKLFEGKGHAAAVSSIAFSGDGKSLATGGRDRKVQVWNVVDKKP